MRLKRSSTTTSSLLLTATLLWVLCTRTCVCDEARAPVVDSASRGHHEAVPPDPDDHTASTDDVIVSPINHHGHHVGGLTGPGHHGSGGKGSEVQRFQVAKVDFHHVATPFIISVWIIIAGFAKIEGSGGVTPSAEVSIVRPRFSCAPTDGATVVEAYEGRLRCGE
ncbi:unnamed protein product [Ixodes persulcatus]